MPEETYLKRLIYIGTGVLVFLISIFVTFPDKRIKQITVVQSEKLLDNRYDIEIGDFNFWWLGGIAFDDITIQKRQISEDSAKNNDKEGKTQGAPPFKFAIQSVGVRFAPLSSLLNLGLAGAFEVELGGGSITGQGGITTSSRFVTVETDDFSLQKTPMLARATGIPVSGLLNLEANLQFFGGKPVVKSGNIYLDLNQFRVGPGAIKSDKFGAMAYIDVPETNLGNLVGRLSIDKKKNRPPRLNFDKLALENGPHIKGEVWGDIKLGRTARSSQAKLQMRFQFNETYIQNNDLGSVLNMKWFREGKRKSWYGFLLWGSLAQLNFKGAPNATEGPSANKNSKSKNKQK